MTARSGAGGFGGRILAILLSLAAGHFLSMFFRASPGVLGPHLMRDPGISAESLGLLTGSYFLLLGLAQIPAGIALDRFGPRRTIVAMMLIAACGAVLFATATSGAGLAAGRGLMGAGFAPALMGALVLYSRWLPPNRFATATGLTIGLGSLGLILATAPLALATETIGWRAAIAVMAGVTVAVALLDAIVLRDAPSDHVYHGQAPETAGEIPHGFADLLGDRRIWLILAMGSVASVGIMVVLGLWGAPYLADIHGLSNVDRGNLLLAMALLGTVSYIVCGTLDRVFDTRKWLVIFGIAGNIAVFTFLAALPGLSLGSAVAAFLVIGALSGFNVPLLAHCRALLPERLIGRGMATLNLSIMVGVALAQIATGMIVGAFAPASAAAPEDAYRALFAFVALAMTVGLAFYLPLADIRPSEEHAAAENG
ncbi:MAG: MFS transporter [Alphaproteobacteria bacterium]